MFYLSEFFYLKRDHLTDPLCMQFIPGGNDWNNKNSSVVALQERLCSVHNGCLESKDPMVVTRNNHASRRSQNTHVKGAMTTARC